MTDDRYQTVTQVRHWDERVFSFRVTRPPSLRFRSGEFIMIGLPDEAGKPIMRAYSIASPAWDDELEFYSIKVPDGPLTSRLQTIDAGDRILLGTKPVGTLVHDALAPGRRLWLLATGTGIAPFASVLRDPETFETFEEIVVMHCCRSLSELAYGAALIEGLATTPLIDEMLAGRKLHFYPTTTREPSRYRGRITDTLASGQVFRDLGLAPLEPAGDRVMVCGSLGFNEDIKALLEARGFTEGSNAAPADYVIEKAFVGEGV